MLPGVAGSGGLTRQAAARATASCVEIEHEFHIFRNEQDHNECEVPRPIWR